MKICNQCKKTFSDNEAYCDTCGSPLSSIAGAPVAVVEKNKTDKAKKILIAVVIVLSVLASFTGIMSIVLYSEYNAAESWLLDERDQNQELKMDNQLLKNEVDFYETHIALVNEEDKYYHKQSCDYFDDSSFWAYNTEQAKTKGYSACPKCYKE